MTDVELTPDPSAIVQAEYDPTDQGAPVRVCQDGPVRTQELPRASSGLRGITVTDTTPVRLLMADPYRAIARIITADKAITVAGSAQEVTGGSPGPLPTSFCFEFTAVDELWAMATDTDTTTVVTVQQERWANG